MTLIYYNPILIVVFLLCSFFFFFFVFVLYVTFVWLSSKLISINSNLYSVYIWGSDLPRIWSGWQADFLDVLVDMVDCGGAIHEMYFPSEFIK